MTVYVDDMHRYPAGHFRRMKMSHMIGDSEDELHAMATLIGVARRWYQGDHYDVSKTKRDLALKLGAIAITWRRCGLMTANRKATGSLGKPDTAEEIWRERKGLPASKTLPEVEEPQGELL